MKSEAAESLKRGKGKLWRVCMYLSCSTPLTADPVESEEEVTVPPRRLRGRTKTDVGEDVYVSWWCALFEASDPRLSGLPN